MAGLDVFPPDLAKGQSDSVQPLVERPAGPFSNRESPLTLDQIDVAHIIPVPAGHGDDMGQTVEIARKTGAQVVATFELANWLVGRGVESGKILRSAPGSRLEIDGIKIQVVNSVHGSGAAPLPGQPASVYGGSALTLDLQLFGRLYKPHVALLPIGCCMYPEETAMATEFLMTDNPNLHSVFPTHHASFLPPAQQGSAFVREVQARRLRREITAFDPKPGQVFLVNASGTRAR